MIRTLESKPGEVPTISRLMDTEVQAKVIEEVQGWVATGRSCFEELLEELGLSRPAQSVLEKVLPTPSG